MREPARTGTAPRDSHYVEPNDLSPSPDPLPQSPTQLPPLRPRATCANRERNWEFPDRPAANHWLRPESRSMHPESPWEAKPDRWRESVGAGSPRSIRRCQPTAADRWGSAEETDGNDRSDQEWHRDRNSRKSPPEQVVIEKVQREVYSVEARLSTDRKISQGGQNRYHRKPHNVTPGPLHRLDQFPA